MEHWVCLLMGGGGAAAVRLQGCSSVARLQGAPTTSDALFTEPRCQPPWPACAGPVPSASPSEPVDMSVLWHFPHPILLQDVVYYFKPTKTVTVTASLCGSSALASTFDARLYLLAGVDGGGALKAAACSNDACGKLPALTVGDRAGGLGIGGHGCHSWCVHDLCCTERHHFVACSWYSTCSSTCASSLHSTPAGRAPGGRGLRFCGGWRERRVGPVLH